MNIATILNLFEGATKASAIALTVAAFVAGMIFMCILCKIFCPCGKKAASSCKKSSGAATAAAKKTEEKPFEKRKPHPAPADGSVEIYVGNLSYDMTEEQLRAEFEKHGKVNSVRLVTNKFNGRSKGFGFVQMPVRAEAEAACAALDDFEIMGRKIKCNEAKNLI